MNQNGKHISAFIRDPESKKYNISVIPNCLKLVNRIFGLEKLDFRFSRPLQSKCRLGGMKWL